LVVSSQSILGRNSRLRSSDIMDLTHFFTSLRSWHVHREDRQDLA
jgi:hypothetical protein